MRKYLYVISLCLVIVMAFAMLSGCDMVKKDFIDNSGSDSSVTPSDENDSDPGVGDVKPCEHSGGKATCTQKAICVQCGEAYGDSLGHNSITDEATAPTCTSVGLTEGEHCDVCNAIIVEQIVVEALGHTETTVVENLIEAKCTSEGSYDSAVYCSVCDSELFRENMTIPKSTHNFVDGYCSVCDAECPYVLEGNYIYFGNYPQTLKADDVTVRDVNDIHGYYLGSDDCYYVKVVADPYSDYYKFSNGDEITTGAEYYFKIEPIRWRILFTDGDTALLMCDIIIDIGVYSDLFNYYNSSNVRKWLNATFYETAFSDLQHELILTTAVDNSVMEDKVFLLSASEAVKSEYGFSSGSDYDTARRMQMSDYVTAKGGYFQWWLRSPADWNYGVKTVNNMGSLTSGINSTTSSCGIVPAIWIKL